MQTNLITAPSYQSGKLIRGVAFVPDGYSQDQAVIFIAGFERFGAEPKRRNLRSRLGDQGIISVNFDFTGLGISDGVYNNPTIDHCIEDLSKIITETIKQYGVKTVTLIGHSVGSCIALAAYHNPDLKLLINKLILLAPALNQTQLTRYWFTMGNNKDIEITFENYMQYLDESAYQKSIQSQQTKKANLIAPEYSQEMAQANFESLLPQDDTNITAVFGSRDTVVPRVSAQYQFTNEVIINGGDHDLEKPGIIDQRIPKVINFIIK